MDHMVLGRVGHFHVPDGDGAGSCQVAIVAHVHPSADGGELVNVAGFQHDGEPFRHLDVPVYVEEGFAKASFHLTRDCPYGR